MRTHRTAAALLAACALAVVHKVGGTAVPPTGPGAPGDTVKKAAADGTADTGSTTAGTRR
ncbi:hypothetical protein [Streptomyces sp. NPDC020965]|uniref:hypothetical protein n=1 Tax=Streptomyces sp. NPDC020965 TaxID=3365105 RepID=UPI00379CC71C